MTKMVYKCPGNPKRPDHIKIGDDVIDYKIVSDEDFDGAVKDGWAASPEEARSSAAPAKRKAAPRRKRAVAEAPVETDQE